MTDHPILDTKSLDELAAAGADFLVEMLQLLLDTGSRQVIEMSVCLERGDMEALAKVAHSLKGAAAGVGAAELSQTCARLEQAGRDGTADSALMDQVAASFERTKNAVANVLSDRA